MVLSPGWYDWMAPFPWYHHLLISHGTVAMVPSIQWSSQLYSWILELSSPATLEVVGLGG